MIIAAAQTIPAKQNISQNLADHYRLVNLAADHGAQLVVFPEMSLTGYERELAADLAFLENDKRLDQLRKLANERNIVILAGAPILLKSGLHIGMFILEPNKTETIYTKQYLHEGEEIAFVPGEVNDLVVEVGTEIVSTAICADITNPAHPARAALAHSTLYIASIFYTPNGIAQGLTDLAKYAKTFSMNVLMSNFGGDSYGFASGGKSSFWQRNGDLIGSLDGTGEGLLIVEREDSQWKSKVLHTN